MGPRSPVFVHLHWEHTCVARCNDIMIHACIQQEPSESRQNAFQLSAWPLGIDWAPSSMKWRFFSLEGSFSLSKNLLFVGNRYLLWGLGSPILPHAKHVESIAHVCELIDDDFIAQFFCPGHLLFARSWLLSSVHLVLMNLMFFCDTITAPFFFSLVESFFQYSFNSSSHKKKILLFPFFGIECSGCETSSWL